MKLLLYTSFAIYGKRYTFNQQLAMIGAMLRLAKNKININTIAYTIVWIQIRFDVSSVELNKLSWVGLAGDFDNC